jgi:hypothetical protein
LIFGQNGGGNRLEQIEAQNTKENDKCKNKDKNNSNKIKILNKKRERNQFTLSSGLFPLTSNSGAGTFDRGFLNVSVPSQGW